MKVNLELVGYNPGWTTYWHIVNFLISLQFIIIYLQYGSIGDEFWEILLTAKACWEMLVGCYMMVPIICRVYRHTQPPSRSAISVRNWHPPQRLWKGDDEDGHHNKVWHAYLLGGSLYLVRHTLFKRWILIQAPTRGCGKTLRCQWSALSISKSWEQFFCMHIGVHTILMTKSTCKTIHLSNFKSLSILFIYILYHFLLQCRWIAEFIYKGNYYIYIHI